MVTITVRDQVTSFIVLPPGVGPVDYFHHFGQQLVIPNYLADCSIIASIGIGIVALMVPVLKKKKD